MNRAWYFFLLLLLAMPSRGQDSQQLLSAEVVFADGRPTQSVMLAQLAVPEQEWFMAGSDLADLLQVGRFYRDDVRKLVLRVGERRITFTSGARSVVSGDETILLRQDVRFYQGEPWIPLEFLTTVLPQWSDRSARWDEGRSWLRLGERSTNIQRLEIATEPLATLIRIHLREPLASRVDDSQAQRLSVKFYGGELNPAQFAQSGAVGLVENVQASQHEGFALLDIQLSSLAVRYQSLTEDDGRTLLLRIEQAPITTIPDPVPRGRLLVQSLPEGREGEGVTVRRVVLDPGHGGTDTGKEGVGGRLEKDITLELAQRVARILQERDDLEVFLTRDNDQDIDLIERTELANRAAGDLFVSIHCNGWYSSDANGVETYFLAPAKSKWDAQVAREENGGVGAAEDLDFILWDLVQNEYINESATLAEAVQQRLSRDMKLRDRGVKQAGFRVLVGAFMPAILVEVGFLSNPTDARKISDNASQDRLATALADAIVDFRERMDALRESTR